MPVQFVSSEVFDTTGGVTIAAVTSGNALIVLAQVGFGTPTSFTVTDNQSNSYGSPDFTYTDGGGEVFRGWHLNNITNGPTSVTFTVDAGLILTAVVCEVAETLTYDTNNSNSGTGTSATATATAAANAVGFGIVQTGSEVTHNSNSPWVAESPFVADPEATGTTLSYHAADDLGAAGSKTLTTTLSSSVAWEQFMALYSTGGGGGTSTPAFRLSLLGVGF